MLDLLNSVRVKLDRWIEFLGGAVSWLIMVLVILVSYDVAMRYLFQSGSIAIQELEWHLFSVIFLFGAAYTLKHDDHVRLDLIYKSRFMNDYLRAWINLLGSILLLLPFCILIIASSWPFVLQAWTHMESSPDPGGLPWRWILKSAIPLAFILLVVQGISSAIENLLVITGRTRR